MGVPGQAGSLHSKNSEPNLALVLNELRVRVPDEVPNSEWRDAMTQLLSWLNLSVSHVHTDRPQTLRQLIQRLRGSGTAPEPPLFAPWILHSCLAFQDPRAIRQIFPARWVASYLWEPQGSAGGAVDVMLISPHPAACEHDEESYASLPGAPLLQDMICAAQAEERRRVAIIGHARTRGAIMRQYLLANTMLLEEHLDLEVIAIEEALTRLVDHAGIWDAIIVLPELRSLVFSLLAKLTAPEAAWPMTWHREGLALLCGETSGAPTTNARLDAALLAQGLALAVRHSGNTPAAHRLSEGWARLRGRGIVTASRGSPSPSTLRVTDAAYVNIIGMQPKAPCPPIRAWKAMTGTRQGHESAPTLPSPARLELVRSV